MFHSAFRGTYTSIANILNLLEHDSTQLEDILLESDVIQECNSENNLLIEFFCKQDNLEKLLFYTIGGDGDLHSDFKRQKFAFVCCELLCCEVDRLLLAYLKGKGQPCLVRYVQFLQRADLPPADCGYFSRIVSAFISRFPSESMDFLVQSTGSWFTDGLARHLSMPPITELTLRLLHVVSEELGRQCYLVDWMDAQGSGFFTGLYKAVCAPPVVNSDSDPQLEESNYLHRMAAQQTLLALGAFEKRKRLFVQLFKREENARLLVESIAACLSDDLDRYVVGQTLSVIVSFVNGALQKIERCSEAIRLLEAALRESQLFPKFVKFIAAKRNSGATESSHLFMIEVVGFFLSVGSDAIAQLAIENSLVETIVGVFFSHPFNNCLHQAVVDAICGIFKNGNQRLMEALILRCSLICKICAAFRADAAFNALPLGGMACDEPVPRYMGHLISIVDLLCCAQEEGKFPLDSPCVLALEGGEWREFLLSVWAPLKEREFGTLGGGTVPSAGGGGALAKDVAHSHGSNASLTETLEEILGIGSLEKMQDERIGAFIVTELSLLVPNQFLNLTGGKDSPEE